MPKIAKRIQHPGSKGAFEIWEKGMALEAAGHDIIHLEIGEPDFKTPLPILDEAERAMRAGRTTYTHSAGSPGLRRAAAEYLASSRQIDALPENVLIGAGVKELLFYAAMGLMEPGDEILVPDPGYPHYTSMMNYVGGKAVPYQLRPENRFMPDPDQLAGLITPQTKALMLNSPGNPTGMIIPEELLAKIAEVVLEHDLWVVSDEIYAQIYFTERFPPSISAQPGMLERTILLDGMSKAYSMTGWRVGFAHFPAPLVPHLDRLGAHIHSCLPPFIMDAAEMALSGPQDSVYKVRDAYRERSEWLYQAFLTLPGVKPLKAEGAFYLFVDVSALCEGDDQAFANRLLEAGVGVLPGSGLGQMGRGFIRIALTQPIERMQEAIERIARLVNV